MLITIYLLTAFIFVFFFLDGFSKFQQEKRTFSKCLLPSLAIVSRLFFLLVKGIAYSTVVNCFFDLFIGWCLYKMACTFYSSFKAQLCAAFYLLSPITLIYSCTLNNLTSPYLLLLLFICWFIYKQKWVYAYLLFAISCICFPRIIVLSPIFLLAGYHRLTSKQYDSIFLRNTLLNLLITFLLGAYFISMPHQLTAYQTEYPFVSINACNLWTLLGQNWAAISGSYLMFSFHTWKFLMLTISLLLIVFFYLHWHTKKNFYLPLCFLLLFSVFVFNLGINDQFFQMILFVLLILVITTASKKLYYLYLVLTALHFFNLTYSFFIYDAQNFNANNGFAILIAFLCILAFLFTLIGFYNGYFKDNSLQQTLPALNKSDTHLLQQKIFIYNLHFSFRDYLYLGILLLLFAFTCFYRLGNHYAPETTYTLTKQNSEILLDLGSLKKVDHLSIFLGRLPKRSISLSILDEQTKEWKVITSDTKVTSVFAWNEIEVNAQTRYLNIVFLGEEAYFNELAVVDENRQTLLPINASQYPALFDEQALFEPYSTYMTGTMFDEVYHARTAYEFIHQFQTYEISHPPLGKILIAVGIKLFGMNPFGWRFMSAVFGLLTVVLLYLFAKKLFGNTLAAILTTALFVFDFMPLALSRIATLDIFAAFFILLMYYFMYIYCGLIQNKTSLKYSFIPLGLSGLAMGLGIATKWTGVYAGAGLGILFFIAWHRKYQSYKQSSYSQTAKKDLHIFFMKTLLFCLLTFVLIPMSIYVLSYIPFIDEAHHTNLITKAVENIKYIFSYHANLKATHPYSSNWYEWPYIKRPLPYSYDRLSEEICTAVNCMGNPLIWWSGIGAVFFLFYCWFKQKDSKAAFLCIAYSAQLIPWMLVTRCIFIYHYFASLLFTFLMMGYAIEKLLHTHPKAKRILVIYFLAIIAVYIAFYPIITGLPIHQPWASYWLKWLPSWVLC